MIRFCSTRWKFSIEMELLELKMTIIYAKQDSILKLWTRNKSLEAMKWNFEINLLIDPQMGYDLWPENEN